MGPPYDSATFKYHGFDYDITKGALRQFNEAAHLLISQCSVQNEHKSFKLRNNQFSYVVPLCPAPSWKDHSIRGRPAKRRRMKSCDCFAFTQKGVRANGRDKREGQAVVRHPCPIFHIPYLGVLMAKEWISRS
jgi:predicted GNAT family acetyltransferase